MKKTTTLGLLALMLFMVSCGGKEFVKNPVDTLIRDMNSESVFSIILYDMEVEGNFSKTYKHQYQIITEKDSIPQEKLTDWYPVSKDFFTYHENNMGMEIASKGRDGKVDKTVSPAGYSNYVGNPQYGNWVQRDGGSFWEFYGKYAMLSSVFHMMTYPARMSYYNDYRSNYYGRGRSYYGPTTGGRSTYGTYSDYNTKTKPNSRFTRSSSFKNKVNSRVQRSTSSSSKTSSSKTSRSSNRYSGSSRSRSFGGGGK
ncbi:MAG: hypothetical protein K9H64_12740 [Bacteroidales bacterium]|nr:hypothetical protein [Bacteroidales bacterium]MCF8456885.1 hypothetical protein [Bacteroidales bacterium]